MENPEFIDFSNLYYWSHCLLVFFQGASGHEVEVEVLKRRLASYKACISTLKSSLSQGQATSLVDPEHGE